MRGLAWRPGPARWSAPPARSWWTTPRLVRGLSALCVAVRPGAAAVSATVLGGARQGIDDIGHRAAPQGRPQRRPVLRAQRHGRPR
ncbi:MULTISPECIES: hypothetical protein [Kitasatospora]|uniref:hypothetical protein n=1 Tax=Kitasatospora TaxID=2063 RepID=UPI00117EC8FE|nr:hypothetical protein [Kitasatospora sp. GP30]MDH6140398.1 hypothetical protein [Kitasatospora sp. GP30]